MLRPALLSLLLVPAACATLSADAIPPQVVRAQRAHEGVVRCEALGRSDVATDALQEALRSSVTASGLFQGAVDAGEDWCLRATVVAYEAPEWGLDVTAGVTIHWQLTDTEEAVLWSQHIETEETGTPEDAFAMGEREAFAIAGAVRANLARALEHLANLELTR